MNGHEKLAVVDGRENAPAQPEAKTSVLVHQTLVVIALVTTVTLLLLLVGTTIGVFLVFFASILLAILLRSLGNRLASVTGLPPTWSVGIVLLGLVVAFGLIGWLLEARVESQITELSERLALGGKQLSRYLEKHAWGRIVLAHADDMEQTLSSGGLLGHVTGIVSTSVGAVVNVIVVLFLGMYLAFDPDRYVAGIVHLVPQSKRERTREVLAALQKTLSWWMVGRFLSMVEVGLLTSLGLWLLGVPLPFTLGFLTGLVNFVPNVGPIMATFVTALVGLAVSPLVMLYAIVAQVLIGSFDGFVVTPLIQQRTVSLPAGLILGSQVLIGVLLGGLGLVLATPLAAAIVVLVRKLYVHDVLGDTSVN